MQNATQDCRTIDPVLYVQRDYSPNMATTVLPVAPPFDAPKLLLVGLGHGQAPTILPDMPTAMAFITLNALDGESLGAASPDAILCQLFAADLACQDAFALVERLETLGYRGRILVIAQALPSPAMIEAELQALGPGLRLTVVCT